MVSHDKNDAKAWEQGGLVWEQGGLVCSPGEAAVACNTACHSGHCRQHASGRACRSRAFGVYYVPVDMSTVTIVDTAVSVFGSSAQTTAVHTGTYKRTPRSGGLPPLSAHRPSPRAT